MRRRHFLALGIGGVLFSSCSRTPSNSRPASSDQGPLYKISLAEWSVHRRIQGREEPLLDHLDFPALARSLGIGAVEYVNGLFKDRDSSAPYISELKRRAEGEGVESLLIMIDGEGQLGAPDKSERKKSVAQHIRWLEAAQALGCHAVRVNAYSSGSYDEQMKLAADGLSLLGEEGERFGLDVIVENHGGYSSNGQWLAKVMKAANHSRVGTLPDFGNFRIDEGENYDRYLGVSELMPFARAVSAKSYAFDEQGNETTIDYARMMRVVLEAGYRGHVGIEYEGSGSSEEGIVATKALLDRLHEDLVREGSFR